MLVITFVNTSELAPVSNYEYTVGIISHGKHKLITAGKIANHTRADGWKVLAQKLLTEGVEEV